MSLEKVGALIGEAIVAHFAGAEPPPMSALQAALPAPTFTNSSSTEVCISALEGLSSILTTVDCWPAAEQVIAAAISRLQLLKSQLKKEEEARRAKAMMVKNAGIKPPEPGRSK